MSRISQQDRQLGELEIDELLEGEGFAVGDYNLPAAGPADALAAELLDVGYVEGPPIAAPYESAAERYYNAGYIIGAGDATYNARAQLKAMGCKWHAPKNKWVAPSQQVLDAARAVIKAVTPGSPPPPTKPNPKPNPVSAHPAKRSNRTLPEDSLDPDFVGHPTGKTARANALTAAFGPNHRPTVPTAALTRGPVQLLGTEEMLAELRARGVIEDEPATLAEALLDRPPTERELDDAFDVEDL